MAASAAALIASVKIEPEPALIRFLDDVAKKATVNVLPLKVAPEKEAEDRSVASP